MRNQVKFFIVLAVCLTVASAFGRLGQDKRYQDGTYRGTGTGYSGNITVEVRIQDHRITDIKIIEGVEGERQDAVEKMLQRIIAGQKVEGVDTVTGATETSAAILTAAKKALENALSGGTKAAKEEPPIEYPGGKKSLGARTWLPTPVWVIGSYDAAGKPNFMTAAWVGISCSRPPCVTISLRKATYTYGNLIEREAFTVNLPSEAFASQTSYFGRVSGREVDKLQTTGLTEVKSEFVDAPYVKEFPYVVECRVIHTYEVGLHTMFIGEIKDIKADPTVLDAEGKPDMTMLAPFFFFPPKGGFYSTGPFMGTVEDLKDLKKK